jgi:hyperosmotically inducible periplasmic protein
MKSRSAVQMAVLAGLLFCGSRGVFAQQPATQQPPATSDSAQVPAGDNTKMNQQDRNDNPTTAQQQKENPSDRELTQHVRQAIMQDKSLSTYAHNVKVISRNGTVTLKGPVRSENEKQAIEAKANEVAGKDRVVNDLTVTPEQK